MLPAQQMGAYERMMSGKARFRAVLTTVSHRCAGR
jgi:hypothetical protein